MALRVHAVAFEEQVVERVERLGVEAGGGDIENVGELPGDAEPVEHRLGMFHRTVGEDVFRAVQPLQHRRQIARRRDRAVIDIVDVIEEVVRIDAVFLHQPLHCRAVLPEVALLHPARRVVRQVQRLGDVGADPQVDLGEQVALGGIDRVVEIERPVADMGQVGHGGPLGRLAA